VAKPAIPVETDRPPESTAQVVSIRDVRVHCGCCARRDVCLPLGLAPEALPSLDDAVSARLRIRRRASLYRQGDRFAALYAIRLGTFKTVVLSQDGHEQITGYHTAGEIIGVDGISDSRYACEAIALEDSDVCVLPFDRLVELTLALPALRSNLYRLISRDVCRDQAMMLLLGSRCAEERLVLFLLNVAERHQLLGYSGSELVLRMTREEIASYLGLQLETVSRLFSHLQQVGLLQVQGRAIKLLDTPALKQRVGLDQAAASTRL
jgi:CRP/FNR family transcriptional regulator